MWIGCFSIVSTIQWDILVNNVNQVLVEMQQKELHLIAYQVFNFLLFDILLFDII